MSGFAGSRSLDERRRRRLAVESDEATAETLSTPLPKRAAPAKSPTKTRGPSHFPLRKVISAKLWKHAGVACIGLLLAAAILVAGWAAEIHGARLGSGIVRLCNLREPRLVVWFISVALLL